MRSKLLAVGLAAGAILLSACSDSLAPGEVSEEDRAEIEAILAESGFFGEDLGVEGATADASGSAAFGAAVYLAPRDAQAEVIAPRIWGRRLRSPVRRAFNVEIVEGVATVTREIDFEGHFLLDISDDGQVNPTSKPLNVTMLQSAELVRLNADQVTDSGRRWRLVAVSPQEWVMTDPARQTLTIAQVLVYVNEELVLTITDPGERHEVDGRIPLLHQEDVVRVEATVNEPDNGHTPEAFVFLHLFHASLDTRIWLRRPMEEIEDGVYVRQWTVRQTGRERIAVDAIDSQSFLTAEDDDYSGNVWAIPYRIL
ncbi:MAG: hypothetical protein GTN62_00880 [Gemmatimonadales bacterium]|nr:hypothetical protein [Gemmatimonadales bacterium]NIN48657.1 hypothetical protein [Gemmatimonadales bacterium]NIP06121.1 hypothetical protein [Gemmatimonadales bacterium]NIR01295.1 hypothetical protein [Gemmatimonadales bacterium]